MLTKLAELFPQDERDSFYYSTGRILYIEFGLSTQSEPRDKYLVLLDDKDPPLFFFISSLPRGKFSNCDLCLYRKDYGFLSKDSFLHYGQTISEFDMVDDHFPSKQDILDMLEKDPEKRVKGHLNKADAEELLDNINNRQTSLEPPVKRRITTGLTAYIAGK